MSGPMIFDQSVVRPSPAERIGGLSHTDERLTVIRILCGRDAILAAQPMLVALARRSGQPGTAANLSYFLSLAASLRKTPYLMLVAPRSADPDEPTGAVILCEYRLFGVGLRLFAPEDTTGRRCVIAPPELRAAVAAEATRALLARGAQIIFTAIQHDRRDAAMSQTLDRELSMAAATHGVGSFRWSVLESDPPTYLPLAGTFAETIAPMGQKTRYSIKYFRRRAERDLGCVFVQQVEMTLEEMLAFNRVCSFPVSDDQVRWRYNALPGLTGGVLCGVRDRDGRWLSIISGRRVDHVLEVDWQMNRNDLTIHSLSLVARSYLIEYGIELGCTRLYMEGGTNHYIRNSFATATVTELTVMRQTIYARLVRRIAPRVTPYWNRLAQIVADPSVIWRSH